MYDISVWIGSLNLMGMCIKQGHRQDNTEDDADSTYWEPADSINELYKQLSSKKYREIIPNQLK